MSTTVSGIQRRMIATDAENVSSAACAHAPMISLTKSAWTTTMGTITAMCAELFGRIADAGVQHERIQDAQ